ncbi:hypothetical protein DICPUDRAFT_99393 [Dictyostelium purpureum]|uniref:Uncharacterized protein n=1 Tax=Dictyostelium purpureum TaxID=5786 RepID=F0ZYV1_DICPU|nr:uncharacterized protein DICPUDRAFT_99393 [Dictyostelium purpureum]EGC30891.1 hypothetical protein DICPUDRAFT_99393 [Dictyostelium purpureum]|eukprot:XP_003292596.1 hypothetical protein DICPUDRAFT_99393 [Dictyostelium purpureum]
MKLILFLCILFISNYVYADFDFGKVVSVRKGDDIVRSYSYFGNENGFLLSGGSVNGTISKNNGSAEFDTSVFRFDAGNIIGYPSYSWFYLHGHASVGQNNASLGAASLSSVFIPTFIVEYVDNGNKEGLQIDEDELVGYVNLGALKYKTEKTQETLTDSDGKNYTVFHVTATSTTGLVQFNFTISDHPSQINGSTTISAEQSKIDIAINGYYDETKNPVDKSLKCSILTMLDRKCISTGPSDKNSTLALLSFYAVDKFSMEYEHNHNHGHNSNSNDSSNDDSEHNDDSGDDEIKVENEDEQGFTASFQWVGTAEASFNGTDGEATIRCSVHSNVTDDDHGKFGSDSISGIIKGKSSHKFIIFSFLNATRPSSVIWDPIIGANSISNGTNNSTSSTDSDGSDATKNAIPLSFALLFMILSLLL